MQIPSVKFQGDFEFGSLGVICRYSWKENLLLKNEDEALINELRYLKRNGCQSLVELTILGLDRNVGKLMELSSASGVNVVAGTGESSHQTLSLSPYLHQVQTPAAGIHLG